MNLYQLPSYNIDKWLINLAVLLGHDRENDILHREPSTENDVDGNVDDDTIRSFFHVWPWDPADGAVCWQNAVHNRICQPATWQGSETDWETISQFLTSLQWALSPDFSWSAWSYVELACIFHLRDFKFTDTDPNVFTVAELVPRIKKACICVWKSEGIKLLPEKHNPDRNKAIGKTLTSGTIDGACLLSS